MGARSKMDKGKLIFIGGAKGVGKTALLERLGSEEVVKVVNTGKVKRYSIERDIDFGQELDRLILTPERVILDTHYAVYNGEGFKRNGIYDSLYRLNQIKDLRFVLIDSDPYTVLRRRMGDSSRKRKLEPEHIQQELERNRQYFGEFCSCLGIEGNVFINDDLEQSFKSIRGVLA